MRTPGRSYTQILHDQFPTRQGCLFPVALLKGIYLVLCHYFLYPEARFHVGAGRRGNLPRDFNEQLAQAVPGKRKDRMPACPILTAFQQGKACPLPGQDLA